MNNDLKIIVDNHVELLNLKINKLENKFKSIENLLLKNLNKTNNLNTKINNLNIEDNNLINTKNKKDIENKEENLIKKNTSCNNKKNKLLVPEKFMIEQNDIDNANNLFEIKDLLKFMVSLQDDMKDRLDIIDLEVNNLRKDYDKINTNNNNLDNNLDNNAENFHSIINNSTSYF